MTNQGRLDFGPRLRPARIMLPRSAWLLIIAGRFGLLSAAHAEPDNLRAPTAPIETTTQRAESAHLITQAICHVASDPWSLGTERLCQVFTQPG